MFVTKRGRLWMSAKRISGVVWRRCRTVDYGIGADSIACRRSECEQDSLLVGVRVTFEPEGLFDSEKFRLIGLARFEIL